MMTETTATTSTARKGSRRSRSGRICAMGWGDRPPACVLCSVGWEGAGRGGPGDSAGRDATGGDETSGRTVGDGAGGGGGNDGGGGDGGDGDGGGGAGGGGGGGEGVGDGRHSPWPTLITVPSIRTITWSVPIQISITGSGVGAAEGAEALIPSSPHSSPADKALAITGSA